MAKATRYTPEFIKENLDKGYWTKTTYVDIWDRNAAEYPDKEAVVDSHTRLTWSQAKLWIDRVALGLLEMGFKKDEVLVVQLPNSVELTLLRVATEKAGILCLPLMRTFRHKEVEYALKYTEAAGVVVPVTFRDFDYIKMLGEIKGNLPSLRHIFTVGDSTPAGTVSIGRMVETPIEQKYPADYLQKTKTPFDEFTLIFLTSGSTGFPKFVENPICSITCREYWLAKHLKFTRDDVFALISPTAGGANGRAYCGAPIVGGKIVNLEKFDAEDVLKLIERERVTVLPAVPAMFSMMLNHPNLNKYDLSSVKYILSMGAVLPFDIGMEIEKKMGKMLQNYSSIDCSAACHTLPEQPAEQRILTCGKTYAWAELKLVDDDGKEVTAGGVGEIILKGPAAASGYFKDPDTTWKTWTRDGWFKMGDLGKLDEHGNLIIAGRKKDMIIRGGQNIYPVEIENLLVVHPKVLSAAVVGMPDPVLGEKACAYVVPKENQEFEFADMISYLKENNLPGFKLPERLEVIEKMPMVAEGQKIDKKTLMQDIADKLKAEKIS
ncbi:MAG: AMP-binding protein [Dehalococcoidia bacterium]|nr:AMP-binding protein [Dehalococcoidia bacterium]MDZ4247419.1 AMP-binding protein [Dehalococcoidia bacterium]